MDTKNGLGVIKSFIHTVVYSLNTRRTKFRLLLHSLMVIVFYCNTVVLSSYTIFHSIFMISS